MNKYLSPDYVQAVIWENNRLKLLDQRYLPGEEVYVFCNNAEEVYSSIKDMVVRGAPAIGITAAYGAYLSAQCIDEEQGLNFKAQITSDLERINSARPTAVNLMWAVSKAKEIVELAGSLDELKVSLLNFALTTHQEDISNNENMGNLAYEVMASDNVDLKFSVITHCNAGSLATGGYGTALGAIRAGYRKGIIEQVYADETRPWMQGSRLTAWELKKSGIPVIINTEGASATLLSEMNIKWVIVGADRIAANGDVANKIGTYGLAILAKYHDVKVMVVAPSSTIDITTPSGKDIDIEHRDSKEVLCITDQNIAPSGIGAYNPVFDVTPACLIDCIVTEKGVVHKPNVEKLKAMFS